MVRRVLAFSFGALLLGALGIASAQNAYTSRPMNVRAGPNRDYPLVAQLGPGAPLEVQGCLSDWSWCNVSFDGTWGWMYSGGISFLYHGEPVPIYSYGPSLGVPIITFSLFSYWGDHYRDRPWYSRRDEWAHRRMPPRMRPPGPPRRGPPPLPYGRPRGGARPGPQHFQPGRNARPGPPYRQPSGHARPGPGGEMRGQAAPAHQMPPRRQPPRGPQRRPPPNAAHHPPHDGGGGHPPPLGH